MTEWVFFDLGWTLVDETRCHEVRAQQVCQILDELGIRLSPRQFLDLCEDAACDRASSPFLGALEALGLSAEQRASIMKDAPYDHDGEVLYPGVADLLEGLHRGLKLGVIANQSEGTKRRLVSIGIRQHFDAILASAELGLKKPDPKIFASAASLAGFPGSNLAMVGDRIDNDIIPANAMGWTTIRVTQGFSRSDVPRSEGERPDFTVATVAEVAALEPLAAQG